MDTFLNMVVPKALEVVAIVLCAGLSWLAIRLKSLVSSFFETETATSLSKIVVSATEQTCQNLHGEEKLNNALDMFSEMLANRGIAVSVDDMRAMIESAVFELNSATSEEASAE